MTLNYKVFGEEGFDVIILHGLFGMLDNWQTFAKQLAGNGYRVWIIDQRNHGKSPHSDEFNYNLLAEDLLHFMDEHTIEDAYIMGHSMGGKTALQFIANYPDRVKKLIVVDIAPRKYKPHHHTIFEALQNCDLTKVEKRGDADELLAEKIEEVGVRMFLMKNITRDVDNGGYRWKMNLPVLINNYDQINVPTETRGMVITTNVLFVKGSKSNYITDEDVEELSDIFVNSTVATLSAGHWVHVDQPQKLLEEVLEFIK